MPRELRIQLPARGWEPRHYQLEAWLAFERGVTRFCEPWHRRAGKDEFALAAAAVGAHRRVGTYWHMLPKANQARKAIWDAVNPNTGRTRIDDAFPDGLRASTRSQDMFLQFHNASTWQVLGSDNFGAAIGSPPVGVVFSEYSQADPNAWAFIRPILAENGGWAMFISTPRGRNHFFRMYEYAKNDPTWHTQHLTVEQTGAVSMDIIDTERRELRAERGYAEADALIAQEWYCDWNAAIPGSYYGALMDRLEKAGRVGDYPFVPGLPVFSAWDIGKGDQTVVWFFQVLENGRIRIIDVLSGSGVGLDYYARAILSRGWVMPFNIWPPDGGIHEWGNESSRPEQAQKYGLKPYVLSVDQRGSREMGIAAVRTLLQDIEFNKTPAPWPHEIAEAKNLEDAQQAANDRMARGIDGMREYHREWDELRKTFRDEPVHDWASDYADSMRYLALGRRHIPSGMLPGAAQLGPRQTVALSDYSMFG
jgi:hypothetical protein